MPADDANKVAKLTECVNTGELLFEKTNYLMIFQSLSKRQVH